ncbi:sulfurtransferase TusA family protein [Streptomyces lunaelactis]|uniref:sulfurtransferase TusA family protein n=1 Tax=Streptomyces lunaelactis TaxID=1535768 RepID=UPI0015859792|nr:sulfurtransferase TusA family protein [Streptomyces lunaelactis]NUK55326.1 sulfurtransferase TusA family protein [Streptomyces lunaelactis]NUK65624.1 sulfurtransferase TusA family protein [Streptomyces lunaelactis]
MTASVRPGPPLVVDGSGLLCVTLLLRLRREIDGALPGTVVHVKATDPAAPLDLAAWSHLTGHTYLGPVPGDGIAATYAFVVAESAQRTDPGSPWRLDTVAGAGGDGAGPAIEQTPVP